MTVLPTALPEEGDVLIGNTRSTRRDKPDPGQAPLWENPAYGAVEMRKPRQQRGISQEASDQIAQCFEADNRVSCWLVIATAAVGPYGIALMMHRGPECVSRSGRHGGECRPVEEQRARTLLRTPSGGATDGSVDCLWSFRSLYCARHRDESLTLSEVRQLTCCAHERPR